MKINAFLGIATCQILLISHGLALVSPPVNVTVSCENFNVIVFWNYTASHRQLDFRINVIGDSGNTTDQTSHHHYNISHFLWKKLDRYYAQVIAFNESEESTVANSPTFTFSKFLPATLQCKLDFPPVRLSIENRRMGVRITNPISLYRRNLSTSSPVFLLNKVLELEYNIIYNLSYETISCDVNKDICEYLFSVPKKRKEYCVNLSGTIGHPAELIEFKEIKSICLPDNTTDARDAQSDYSSPLPYLIIFPLLITVIVGTMPVVICLMRCTKSPPTPNSLASISFSGHDRAATMPLLREKLDVISSVDLILPTTDLEEYLAEYPPEQCHGGTGSSSEWGEVGVVWEEQGSGGSLARTDPQEDLEPGSEASSTGSDEEVGFSGYDRPQMLEMSPGDLVEGYGPS